MTTLIIIAVVVLLIARILYLTYRRLTNPPKYRLGDRVKFVWGLDSDYVTVGQIWKIHRYWLMSPAYEIYTPDDYNHYVSEPKIIELLERTNKVPCNPLKR